VRERAVAEVCGIESKSPEFTNQSIISPRMQLTSNTCNNSKYEYENENEKYEYMMMNDADS